MQNINKPSHFGNDDVLNFKLVSAPCKKLCFCYNPNSKDYHNFIEQFNTVNSTSGCMHIRETVMEFSLFSLVCKESYPNFV